MTSSRIATGLGLVEFAALMLANGTKIVRVRGGYEVRKDGVRFVQTETFADACEVVTAVPAKSAAQ